MLELSAGLIIKLCLRIATNESVFAMAGYSVFRHADTEVHYCFIVEDNICRLIINVKPELKLIKVLLPIALPSSPAIANTFCCVQFESN